MSIIATLLFLIGCISPATQNLALYRTDVNLLANALINLAPGTTQDVSSLLNPGLPVHWYWGSSGICDVFEGRSTRCRRSFPATQGLVKVVEESMRDNLAPGQENVIQRIVSAWDLAVKNIPSSILVDKHGSYAANIKASVALATLSLIVEFGLLAFHALADGSRLILFISFANGIVALIAGSFAVAAYRDFVHSVVSMRGETGPGFIVLFLGVGLRILANALSCCCSGSKEHTSRSSSSAPAMSEEEERTRDLRNRYYFEEERKEQKKKEARRRW